MAICDRLSSGSGATPSTSEPFKNSVRRCPAKRSIPLNTCSSRCASPLWTRWAANYVRRPEVRGTWLESHFRWQLRTFWIAALLIIVSWPLVITIVLIPFVWIFYVAVGLWSAYRVARGWIALRDGRAMPVS